MYGHHVTHSTYWITPLKLKAQQLLSLRLDHHQDPPLHGFTCFATSPDVTCPSYGVTRQTNFEDYEVKQLNFRAVTKACPSSRI